MRGRVLRQPQRAAYRALRLSWRGCAVMTSKASMAEAARMWASVGGADSMSTRAGARLPRAAPQRH
eukprot:5319533-Lingulodinium_polyedra.AAC.1